MKKALSLTLAIVMVFALCACGQQAAAPKTEEPAGAPAAESAAAAPAAEPAVAPEAAPAPSAADSWPSAPITLYVGFSAGGSSDLQARYVAAELGNILGVSVVVENVPGSAGALCYSQVLNECERDGYSFCLANMPALDMGKYDEANPREFGVDDFDLICNHVTDYNVLAIRNDETRFTDIDSLVAYSKENGPLLVGAAATGITSDDATILQKLNTGLGLEYEIVPTGGSKETETLFIQGNADILIANVADVTVAHNAGQYKVLCVFSEERSGMLPDVPAFAELGYDVSIVNFSARGYAYPKGVDEAIIAKMAAALEQAINSETVMTQMSELGAEIDFRAPEAYNALIEADIASGCAAFGVNP